MLLKYPLRIFFFFLVIYLATMGGHLYSPDEEILFRTTQSLAERASLAIEPLEGFATKRGPDGREYAQYGIGQPLLAIPFYYFGKLLYATFPTENASQWFSDTMQYHDGSARAVMLRLGVSVFNQFVSAFLCAVLFAFAFRLTKDFYAALMTALLFGLGTFAWVHSKPFFTEPLAALLTFWSFFLLYIGMEEKSTGRILIAGLLYAYALLVRLDSIFMLPGYFAYIFVANARGSGWNIRKAVRAQFRAVNSHSRLQSNRASLVNSHQSIVPDTNTGNALLKRYLFFAPILLAIIVLLFLNKIRFGAFLSTGYEDQTAGLKFSTPLVAGLYGFLFSAGKGLFFFSPPLVLFFFAIRKFCKEYMALAVGLCVLILSFFLVQCKWQNWPGGWCWGPRHIYQIHIFLALPIAVLFAPPRKSLIRIAFGVLIVIGAAVQLYGCSQNFIDYYFEFFATPRTPPNNYNVWYKESEQFLDGAYALYILDKNGRTIKRVPLHQLVSPIANSVYYPQDTVWAGYVKMLGQGRHDFFWLKLSPKFILDRTTRINLEQHSRNQK